MTKSTAPSPWSGLPRLLPSPTAGPVHSAAEMSRDLNFDVGDLLARVRILEEDVENKNGQIVVLQQAVANLIRRVDQLETHNATGSTGLHQSRDSQSLIPRISQSIAYSPSARDIKPQTSSHNLSSPTQDSRLPKPKFIGIEKSKRDIKRAVNSSKSAERHSLNNSIIRSRYAGTLIILHQSVE